MTFANYHPIVIFVYFIGLISTAMFAVNPIFQAVALFGGFAFSFALYGASAFWKNLRFYLPLLLLVTLTNPLFSHSGATQLFFINGKPITLEAFMYGAYIGATIISVMLWCKCYSTVFTDDKFLYLFGKVLPKLALVLTMTLRFIPMCKRQIGKVSDAQKAMGLYSCDGFLKRVKSASTVFISVIAWSLENAMEVSLSMKSKGYGTSRRSAFSPFCFKLNDGLMLALFALLFSLTIYGMITGVLSFEFYPAVGRLDTSPAAVAAYTAFAVLSLLPVFIEIREALAWKYYVSKI